MRHGTYANYTSGKCRCDDCRAARSKYHRDNYQANRTAKIAAATAWNQSHPEQRRATHLKREYGITPEDYNSMYVDQGGCCGICESSVQLVVDHDHETGRVRGLLCRQCNAAIGGLKDDPETLRRAIRWLED